MTRITLGEGVTIISRIIGRSLSEGTKHESVWQNSDQLDLDQLKCLTDSDFAPRETLNISMKMTSKDSTLKYAQLMKLSF